jgi:hypothetical protein
MGKVDKTLFLLKQGDDILIVQVYVDDIVFGGSSHSLVARFAEDMSKEFEMSMMGELQFFLGFRLSRRKRELLCIKASTRRTFSRSSRLMTRSPCRHR